jgi:pimeloyl-ACP methyl ester carboxylesterase
MNAQPQLQYVQCANPQGSHRMAYWVWGEASNPRVLICVHGLSRQGRDFDTLAANLSDTYRVICPDVVGRGRSDWLSDPMGYQVPQYVADMMTLIATLQAGGSGVRNVDWVGTSMGGLIGLGVAALPNSPVSSNSRFVINDVGPRIEPAAIARIGSYMGRPARWASIDEAADALWAISKPFGPHTQAQWRALTEPQLMDDGQGGYKLRADPGIAVPFKSAAPEAAAAGEALLWQGWDRITARTLLVRGADSDLLSRETAQQMTQRGPRARLVEFAGVGHAPTFVALEQAAAVREFLLSP